MLFFELFPAVVAVVAVIVGIFLFVADRRAARDPDYKEEPRRRAAPVTREQAEAERHGSVRRPSMRS